jgi:hypothetical protein
MASVSLCAQVIVAKTADHLLLHRQEKIFARHSLVNFLRDKPMTKSSILPPCQSIQHLFRNVARGGSKAAQDRQSLW